MKPHPNDDLVFEDLEKALDEAPMPPWDEPRPRFYPLGAHPATYRERYIVDRLRRIHDIACALPGEQPNSELTEQAIAYHVKRIVAIEAKELEAKAEYLRIWADRLGR